MQMGFLLVAALIVICLAGYFFLMIFFSEWVGITGKVARKNLAEHQEGEAKPDHHLFQ